MELLVMVNTGKNREPPAAHQSVLFLGVQDIEGGIVLAYGGHSRLHLFKALNHHEIIQNVVQQAHQFLGIDIKVLKSQITLEQFEKERFGEYSGDQHQTSFSEFSVQKITVRHHEPMKRIMCLTETTLLERDPQTYNVRSVIFKIILTFLICNIF